MSRLALLPLTLLAIPLALSACAPQPAPIATSAPTATVPEPSSSPTMQPPASAPLPDDALLSVTATAESDGEPVAYLSLVVHKSLAWDDPAAAKFGDLVSKSCDGGLDASVYEEQLFTFTQIDFTSMPAVEGEVVSTDLPFGLHPAMGVPTAAIGDVVDADNVDQSTPYCVRQKFLPLVGDGSAVLALEGDTDENLAAGNFTRWANQFYGFYAYDKALNLVDCTYELTDLGKEFGGGGEFWQSIDSGSPCGVGYPEIVAH